MSSGANPPLGAGPAVWSWPRLELAQPFGAGPPLGAALSLGADYCLELDRRLLPAHRLELPHRRNQRRRLRLGRPDDGRFDLPE